MIINSWMVLQIDSVVVLYGYQYELINSARECISVITDTQKSSSAHCSAHYQYN